MEQLRHRRDKLGADAESLTYVKHKYRCRAGIEATFSEMDKKTGIKRLRVRGLPAVRYCAFLKAIAVNIFQAARLKRVPGTTGATAVISWKDSRSFQGCGREE